ncbi:probable ATP-dependent DNA helicase CHR12 [Punica granatum]|uniref:Probable ATP-dependent DNA helicase CHR12 n=1 Tax=Punica granatum TaxID=22663 RepID=A0A6P8C8K2_PUNGR|nr:probable ATP-dependent DNA helicase CHR12 [Punica granatum]XP_031379261.1 probable ATP-dependent DNA helicase CHR12 [Punica granatum]XP_031383050.1 probable ATP-dependent DNA helicase CHR12 [Punica granatum]XP_031383051.1 probable ATP-dependent DNA helicase CHR12 [Punica granatum]
MKAVENGEDISKLKVKGKRRDAPLSENNELGSSMNVVSESGNENGEEESKAASKKGSERVSNGAMSEPRSEVKGAILKFSVKGKRKDPVPSTSNEVGGVGHKNVSIGSEDTGKEDAYGPTPKRLKLEQIEKPDSNSTEVMGWNRQILTWKTHKKKRSSYNSQTTSSDSKGQSSGGRGNG